MKKFIKFLFIAVVVLLVVSFVSIFVFLKTFDVNNYKTIIQKTISDAIGKHVEISRIYLKFGFKDGVYLDLSSLSIAQTNLADDKNNILTVKNLRCAVDVSKLLKEKILFINEIEVNEPAVNVLLEADNKDVIVPTSSSLDITQNKSKAITNVISKKENESNSINPSQKNPFEFYVNSVKIINGQLNLIDASNKINTYVLKNFNFELKNFAVGKEFTIKAKGALFGDVPNLNVEGSGKIGENFSEFAAEKLKVDIDFETISLDGSILNLLPNEIMPIIKNIKDLKGFFVVNIGQLLYQLDSDLIVKYSMNSDNLSFYSEDIKQRVVVNVNLNGDAQKMNVDQFNIILEDGNIEGKAEIQDFSKSNLEFSFDINELELNKFVKIYGQLPIDFMGKMSGDFVGRLKFDDPSRILDSFELEGSMNIPNSVIKNFNLMKILTDKLSEISIFASVPIYGLLSNTALEKRMDIDDTKIDNILANLKIENQICDIVNFEVKHKAAIIDILGQIDFKNNANLSGNMFLSKEVSEELVKKSDGFSELQDELGRIKIPLKSYSGDVSKINMAPDTKFLSKKVVNTVGKQELKKAIFKALDINVTNDQQSDVDQQDGSPQSGSEDTQNKEDKSVRPEAILIENILDKIFK